MKDILRCGAGGSGWAGGGAFGEGGAFDSASRTLAGLSALPPASWERVDARRFAESRASALRSRERKLLPRLKEPLQRKTR